MPDLEALRARLGELARRRRARMDPEPGVAGRGAPAGPATFELGPGAPAAAAPEQMPGSGAPFGMPEAIEIPRGVDDFLPGGEWRDEHGAVWVHERLRSEMERRKPWWGMLEAPPAEEPDLVALAAFGLRRALFLDLETGGLASSPVFLAGTMHWNGEDFVLRQYFARHYGEEEALLRALAVCAPAFEFLVTFNGKTYDVPFLRARAVVHGVDLRLPPRHLDLLHASRRRWRERLPDCRLQTLEAHVCRRRRSGDVPSEEVPGLYHDFVRNGDPWRLVPVFHHNLLDVITMAEILRALCRPERGREPVAGGD